MLGQTHRVSGFADSSLVTQELASWRLPAHEIERSVLDVSRWLNDRL
jgi:hypothetical protein